MVLDSTLDFNKRRNRPLKYDRELMADVVKSMPIINKIKEDRESRFYRNRMKDVKQLENVRARTDIIQNIDLIAPAASKQRLQTNVVEKAKAKLEAKKSVAMET